MVRWTSTCGNCICGNDKFLHLLKRLPRHHHDAAVCGTFKNILARLSSNSPPPSTMSAHGQGLRKVTGSSPLTYAQKWTSFDQNQFLSHLVELLLLGLVVGCFNSSYSFVTTGGNFQELEFEAEAKWSSELRLTTTRWQLATDNWQQATEKSLKVHRSLRAFW